VRGLPLVAALENALVLVTASSPVTICSTVSLLVGLDAALAVVVIVVTTALVPLSLPAVALPLLERALEIPLSTFMLRLGWMVDAAFAIALVARLLAGADRLARRARVLDAIAVIGLVVFAVAIMEGITAGLFDRPGYVLGTLAAVFFANLALQAAGAATFLKLGMRRALTIGLMTGNCNMGLVLVALAGEAPFGTVTFFALDQIPMYALPGLLMPFYRRLSGPRP
jgi:BASS family bile acid:Na+ symporter